MSDAILCVRNPSPYWRGGVVVTPWKDVAAKAKITDDKVHLLDTFNQRPVPAQIDWIDKEDPSRAVLVFRLPGDIRPGADDYADVCAKFRVMSGSLSRPPAGFVDVTGNGVKLRNDLMSIWINLEPEPWHSAGNWFGGSITSMERGRLELLDAVKSYFGVPYHDPEKRLQLDRVQIPRPPWAADPLHYETMFDKRYRVVSWSAGPVRASVTIASEEFEYTLPPPEKGGKAEPYRCSLFRTLSLNGASDAIVEDLYLEARPQKGAKTDFCFAAGYFLMADLSLRPQVTHYPYVPDWFTIACQAVRPHHGFVFATDRHSGHIYNPPPHYPVADTAHRAFAWRIGMGKTARNAYGFGVDLNVDQLNHVSGKLWYEHVYKPFRAEVQ
jgi:hypothetical protein